jgi:hypothetical protein
MILSPSSGGEVDLTDGVLTVRRRERVDEFAFASNELNEASLCFWGQFRGTVLKLRRGQNEIALGGENYWNPALAYAPITDLQPDVTLSRPHFAKVVDSLVNGGGGRPLLVIGREAPRSFCLWWVDSGPSAGLLAVIVLLLGAAASVGAFRVGMPPAVGIAAFALAWVAWIVRLVLRTRRAGRPDAVLVVRDRVVTLSRPDGSNVSPEFAIEPEQVRLARWRAPSGGRSSAPTADGPALEIDRPDLHLSIGALDSRMAPVGPKGRTPDYLVLSSWWPSLVELLGPRP